MLKSEKIIIDLLSEKKINKLLEVVSILNSYKEDLCNLLETNSNSKYSDNFDEENLDLYDFDEENLDLYYDDPVKGPKIIIDNFSFFYFDFLKQFKNIIVDDIWPRSDNEFYSFSYDLEIDNIIKKSDHKIYSFEKLGEENDINNLKINPYNFLYNKLTKIFNKYSEVFIVEEGEELGLSKKIEVIQGLDINRDEISDLLSIIDITNFRLLPLEEFDKKSQAFKETYENKEESNKTFEVIKHQKEILNYFSLQLKIYIDFFIKKMNIKGYTVETDLHYRFLIERIHDIEFNQRVDKSLFKKFDDIRFNDNSINLNDTERSIFYEILNRAIDIKKHLDLFDLNLLNKKKDKKFYHLNWIKNTTLSIPSFKSLETIVTSSPIFQVNHVKEEVWKTINKEQIKKY